MSLTLLRVRPRLYVLFVETDLDELNNVIEKSRIFLLTTVYMSLLLGAETTRLGLDYRLLMSDNGDHGDMPFGRRREKPRATSTQALG